MAENFNVNPTNPSSILQGFKFPSIPNPPKGSPTDKNEIGDNSNPQSSSATSSDQDGFFGNFMSMLSGLLNGNMGDVGGGLNNIYAQEQAREEKIAKDQKEAEDAKAKEAKKSEGEQAVKSAMPTTTADAAATLGDASDFWKNNPNPDKNAVSQAYIDEVATCNPSDGKYSAETIAAAKYISLSESAKRELDSATVKEGPQATDGMYGKADFQELGKGKKPAVSEAVTAAAPKDEQEAANTLGDASDFWENNPSPDKNAVTLDYIKTVGDSNPDDGKYSAKTIAAAKYFVQSENAKRNLDSATVKEGPQATDNSYGRADFTELGKAPPEKVEIKDEKDAARIIRNSPDIWDNSPDPSYLTLPYLKEVAASDPKGGKYSAKTIAAAKYVVENEWTFDKMDQGMDGNRKRDDAIKKEDIEAFLK